MLLYIVRCSARYKVAKLLFHCQVSLQAIINAPLATARALYASMLSISLFVNLCVAKMRAQKRDFLKKKTKQFRATVCTDDQ